MLPRYLLDPLFDIKTGNTGPGSSKCSPGEVRSKSGPHAATRKVATLRPHQIAAHVALLPGTPPALDPGGVGHGRTSRPCNPVSARRARGLANATESQDSQLCYRHTRPPVPRRRPNKLPSLAPGCVGHGLTSARAKPAHTRHAPGLGTRRNHPIRPSQASGRGISV